MFSSSSTDQQQLEAGEAEVAATEELFVEDEDQPFLWEQISGSIDAVELEDGTRVQGSTRGTRTSVEPRAGLRPARGACKKPRKKAFCIFVDVR